MKTEQIIQVAAAATAIVGFVGLLALSYKLRIRPWVLLLAGVGGIALVALVNMLISRITSLAGLAVCMLLICIGAVLAAVVVSMLLRGGRGSAFSGRMGEARLMLTAKPNGATGASNRLAEAQGRELALLSPVSLPQAAIAQLEPEPARALPQPQAEQSDEAVQVMEESLEDDIERLARGFREEQERMAREEQERLIREQEERRQAEERRALEEKMRQEEEEQAAKVEEQRLAKELEEKRLLMEQEQEAKEQERIAKEQQLIAREQEASRVELERLERMEQERLAQLDKDRLEKAEAERLRQEQLQKCIAEANEYIQTGEKLIGMGMHIEALPWLERAARLAIPDELRIRAGIAIVETLAALGWKAEAVKKMQAMKAIALDPASKKKLEGLLKKLLG